MKTSKLLQVVLNSNIMKPIITYLEASITTRFAICLMVAALSILGMLSLLFAFIDIFMVGEINHYSYLLAIVFTTIAGVLMRVVKASDKNI